MNAFYAHYQSNQLLYATRLNVPECAWSIYHNLPSVLAFSQLPFKVSLPNFSCSNLKSIRSVSLSIRFLCLYLLIFSLYPNAIYLCACRYVFCVPNVCLSLFLFSCVSLQRLCFHFVHPLLARLDISLSTFSFGATNEVIISVTRFGQFFALWATF